MELPWTICPFCATAVPGMRKETVPEDEVLPPLSPSLFDDIEDQDQIAEVS